MAKDDPYLGEVIYDGGSAFMEFVRGPEFTAYLESKYPTIAPARDGSRAGTERPQFAVYRNGAPANTVGQRIAWSNIVVNEGNIWDSANHQFKAPTDGNYFISYSLLNSAAAEFYIEVVVNGTALPTNTFPRGYSNTQYGNANGAGILKLNAGDAVGLNVALGTCHGNRCSWTGFLIPKEN